MAAPIAVKEALLLVRFMKLEKCFSLSLSLSVCVCVYIMFPAHICVFLSLSLSRPVVNKNRNGFRVCARIFPCWAWKRERERERDALVLRP